MINELILVLPEVLPLPNVDVEEGRDGDKESDNGASGLKLIAPLVRPPPLLLPV